MTWDQRRALNDSGSDGGGSGAQGPRLLLGQQEGAQTSSGGPWLPRKLGSPACI